MPNGISGSVTPTTHYRVTTTKSSDSKNASDASSHKNLPPLPFREGCSDPRLNNKPLRADFLAKSDSEVLENMRFSKEEMTRTLASNIDLLTANACDMGWDRSFKAASNISMKAMRCIGTDQPGEKSIFALSQKPVREEKRFEYQPFSHSAMSYGSYVSDNYKPVEGDLRITNDEHQAIQRSLLAILEKNFPDEMKALKEENQKLQEDFKNGKFDLNRRSFERISNEE